MRYSWFYCNRTALPKSYVEDGDSNICIHIGGTKLVKLVLKNAEKLGLCDITGKRLIELIQDILLKK